MNDLQITRVWRRLWRTFVRAGGSFDDAATVERFRRLIEREVHLLPPNLSRAALRALSSPTDLDYTHLARDLSTNEARPVLVPTARQRVSRALRKLEDHIRDEDWTTAKSGERVAIVFAPQPTGTPPRPQRGRGVAPSS